MGVRQKPLMQVTLALNANHMTSLSLLIRECGGHLTVEPSGNEAGDYLATYEFPSGNLCIRVFPYWPTEQELLNFLSDSLNNRPL